MFRIALGAVSLAILSFGSVRVSAQEKMTATELIKKSIEASGGADLLRKFPAMKDKSKGTMDMNGLEIAFTSESAYMTPDKMKTTLSLEVMGQKIKALQVVNGDKIRMVANGMDVPLEEAARTELKEGIVLHKVAMLTPLLDDKSFEVKMLDGTSKVGDVDAYVLTVKSKDLRETKLYFDSKTFLMTKLEKRGLNAAQQEGKQEMFLADYKKIDGLMIPMKSKVLHDGKKFLESETTEVKLLDKIANSEFDISD